MNNADRVSMQNIENNLNNIRRSIQVEANRYSRQLDEIKLLAVSKKQSTDAILSCIQAGQFAFGENYVQEGIEKIQFFNQHYPNLKIDWHFIGDLQSNKTQLVANHFSWVQTINRLKIAKRLNEQRQEMSQPLNVLIQVNISQEESKSGISESELFDLAHEIQLLPNLTLRGVMAIPRADQDKNRQFDECLKLKCLFDELKSHFKRIDTLSMGMSNDMDMAIKAGSTMVRIGTAIFGERQ